MQSHLVRHLCHATIQIPGCINTCYPLPICASLCSPVSNRLALKHFHLKYKNNTENFLNGGTSLYSPISNRLAPPKKIKTKKGSLKSNESAHVHNENSNIEKANRVNCDDWAAERAAPSSQEPHLLSEN